MASEFENIRQAQSKTRKERHQERRLARIAARERAENRYSGGLQSQLDQRSWNDQKNRAEHIQEQSHTEETFEEGRTKLRLIPIWLRLLIVTFLALISLTLGLLFGYGVIGDGKAIDILKTSTWGHLIDLVEKDTPKN